MQHPGFYITHHRIFQYSCSVALLLVLDLRIYQKDPYYSHLHNTFYEEAWLILLTLKRKSLIFVKQVHSKLRLLALCKYVCLSFASDIEVINRANIFIRPGNSSIPKYFRNCDVDENSTSDSTAPAMFEKNLGHHQSNICFHHLLFEWTLILLF